MNEMMKILTDFPFQCPCPGPIIITRSFKKDVKEKYMFSSFWNNDSDVSLYHRSCPLSFTLLQIIIIYFRISSDPVASLVICTDIQTCINV